MKTNGRTSWRSMTVAVAIAFGAIFSVYSIWLQTAFRASLDTAVHGQLLWNLSNGRFFETSFLPYSFAGNHFWPTLYVVLPIFDLFGVPGMLATQAFLVGAGALVAYRICLNETNSPQWSFLVACAYLCCPTISSGILHDFHFELFSIPFSLLALLGLQEGKWWFVAPLVFSLGFYEVTGFAWPLLGLAMAVGDKGPRRNLGIVLFLVSAVYFAAVCGFVMPHFRGIPDPHVWVRYSHLGATPSAAFVNVILHPVSCIRESVGKHDIGSFRLILFFGLLPLVGFRRLLPAVPLWAMLLFSRWDLAANIRYGYFAPVVPFLVAAAALGVARLQRRARFAKCEPFAKLFLTLCLVWAVIFYQISKPMRKHPFVPRPNLAAIRTAVSMVPPEASVSADEHFCPALFRRRHLQQAPYTVWKGERAEYMLVDLAEGYGKDSAWVRRVAGMVSEQGYRPIWFEDNVALLQFGGGDAALAERFLQRLDQVAAGSDK